jgi:hypothetical protein
MRNQDEIWLKLEELIRDYPSMSAIDQEYSRNSLRLLAWVLDLTEQQHKDVLFRMVIQER